MEHHKKIFLTERTLGKCFALLCVGAWALSGNIAFATTWSVSITSTGYVPQVVTIQPGDTVAWTNNDLTTPTRGVNSDPHNTHSDYPSLDFDDIPQGDTVSLTFPEPCVHHGYHDHEKDEDVGSITVLGPCPASRREPDKPMFWGNAVTKISTDGALIEWSTERGSYTQIAYGTKSGAYDTTSSADGVLTKYHRAELTGLSPNTTYFYHSIGGGAMDQKFFSEEFPFTTLALPTPTLITSTTTAASTTPSIITATTSPTATTTTMTRLPDMPDMPGMTHHHTGMGVSAYAVRTVHTQKFTADLHYGIRGEAIRTLQEWLIEKKLLHTGLNTGYFGPLTLQAVADYQKSMHLPQTGYFGTSTRQMVDNMGG